jgi:two-component system NarL family sensor kinase
VKLVRNPLVQFLTAGLLLLLAIWWATGALTSRAAKSEAIRDARDTTEVLAHSVAEPAMPRGLVKGNPGAIDRFDREVLDRLLVGDVKRIKIWDARGTVIYSDETQLIGQHFALDSEEREVLTSGTTEGDLSDLHRRENRFEANGEDGLLEVYTRITSPEGQPLLFEAYYSPSSIQQRSDLVFAPFRRINTFAILGLLLLGSPMIWGLTRRLSRIARERERLLRSGLQASEAERRRIARDLHDGVVQDLAGTAFSLSGVAREPDLPPDVRRDLEAASSSVRGSLRSLRSLLVEIHPPGLDIQSLPAALQDLTAPAVDKGMAATVEVTGIDGAPDEVVTLVWRVAQEAVRNATRHANGATMLTVTVHGSHDRVVLEVTDNGSGFDTDAPASETGFGLRGMRSLIADAGGDVAVRSAPGAGTTVRMEVPTR